MKFRKIFDALILAWFTFFFFHTFIKGDPPENVVEKVETEKIQKERINDFEFIETIPDDLNNYRSKQLSEFQLEAALKAGDIKRVIRMNGDGKDAAGVPISTERAVCEKYGVEFHFINAHSKHSPSKVHDMLMRGNTLIHCKHGFDRTGGMVGYHLRKLGWDTEFIISHNKWKNYLEKKGEKFRIYFEMIF